jgi:hypothetical protein
VRNHQSKNRNKIYRYQSKASLGDGIDVSITTAFK